MQLDFDHGMVAAVSAVVGGVLTKYISLSGRKMELEFSEAVEIRRILGKRCEKLEKDLNDFRKEIEKWQAKYYQETGQLRQELSVMSIQLTDIKQRWMPEKERERYA